MPTTKIPKSEYDKIIDMKRNGMKHKDIAKIYDVDASTITDILIKCGVRTNISTNDSVPQGEHQNIIDLYIAGNSQNAIAKIYNTSQSNIGHILKKYDIDCRHKPLNFTIDDIRHMYDMYCDRIKVEEIAKQYEIDVTSVYNLFKRNGFQVREFSDSRREYSLNVNYFDIIDTPNKAYIVGLLYADGCNKGNKNNKYQVDLSLQECDKHILEEISKEIETDKPLGFQPLSLRNPRHKDQYRLCITNKHISNALCELGVIEAKSLVLEFPEWLTDDLYSHFIRGYFDGDGCLYLDRDAKKPEVSIVSTIMFIEKLQEILRDQLGVEMKIKTQKGYKPVTKIGVITGRKKVATFLEWIYKDSDLKLDRKYQKYQRFMEVYNDINNSCSN